MFNGEPEEYAMPEGSVAEAASVPTCDSLVQVPDSTFRIFERSDARMNTEEMA